jgi:hypothetical protein
MSSAPGAPSTLGTWTSVVAATLMIVVGIFQAFVGFVALVDGTEFYVTPNFVFAFDTTTWGWIHLIYGVVVAVAGFFVLTGNVVARTVGIVLAGIQAIVNFTWLPYYPIWSILIIALDVLVIWALATTRLDQAEA